ncbi:MAG TPA: glycerol-3-phosphate dehydrogenase/oxidase [Verrucomicrobia bacterium]|nr:MAG: hypothetical protein A2X46_13665 [Lentisphaerae bacterium GWF2_57_35]HBA82478.1 glycerol-3-phosphate dehydrogenase/oxidase [Verrucomicrobiota bacterium]
MIRNIKQLDDETFDVVIVGGGVYGLSTAWDASLRGLKVAVLEQSDFGKATSSASLKLVHGGLRYLQHLNFARMRVSIGERKHMLYMAPHLVHPLEFLIPCYSHGMKGPEALQLAMLANDVISFDRNIGLDDPEKHIPIGRRTSNEECLRRIPGLKQEGLKGGGSFYDAQMYNSERLTLAFGLSAAAQGCVAANYARVTRFKVEHGRIQAATVKDLIGGNEIEVRGKLFINMTGPWSDITAQLTKTDNPDRRVVRSKGVQLIAKPLADVAFSIESKQKDSTVLIKRGGRNYFVTPWRGKAFFGTTDTLYRGAPEDFAITQKDVAEFVAEMADIFPAAELKYEDVSFWIGGMRPVGEEDSNPEVAKAAHKYEIVDHSREDGIQNLLSIVGVKYTICRHIAQRVVQAVFLKRGKTPPPCTTATTRLAGGHIDRFDDFLREACRTSPWNETITRHLALNYGSDWRSIAKLAEADKSLATTLSGSGEVLRAEVLHAIRNEMALKLTDVVMRRTDLGTLGHPGRSALEECATLMARELGWNDEKRADELTEAEAIYKLPPG